MTTIDTGTTDLLCSVADGVATLTLDDPDRRNALTLPMVDEIVDAVHDLGLRVVRAGLDTKRVSSGRRVEDHRGLDEGPPVAGHLADFGTVNPFASAR